MWKRFLAWCEAYVAYKARKLVEAELYKLSDRELRDMGINRYDIPTLVREASERS